MLHGDLLGERARLTPDKTALVFVPTGERFSYRQLDARASAAAAALTGGLGLAKGDRFGVLSHNRPELLDCFFAAGKSGVIVVPLGTRATAHELAHIVRDSGMKALLYDGAFADTVRALRPLVDLDHYVALDDPAITDPGPRTPDPNPSARSSAPTVAPDPEAIFCLLYTSGTTGKPKGVMVPQRMVAWNAYNTAMCWQLREDDVSPIFTPLYHAGGLGAFLMPIFAIGGTIVLHAGFDPAEIWQTIERERCTVVLGVPTIWKLLMEAPEFAAADLSSVRWLISGGAPLPLYIIEAYQARGVVFKQGYGLTEVGVNCFSMTVGESVRRKGSIGKPMMFTQAKLVDEGGSEVPTGEVGELCLRGPHVCKGYWSNPEATAAALDADGWFHTGDSARRDEEGFYFIAGRQKDMLISGGVNVYPAEIEAELLLHPQVADAAVVGVPHETWGEVGVAFIVPRAQAPSPDTLAAFLAERLAKYKLPKEFIFVDSLPRTPYGKVVKVDLRRSYLAEGGPRGIPASFGPAGGWGPGSGVRGPTHPPEQDPGRGTGHGPRGTDHSLLAFRLDGTGEPLLLLNGGMMSYGAWDPLVPPLAARFQVLRCDLRGQLRSPGTPPAELAGHADDLVALLDHLGIGRCHVVGTSFGGLVGIALAGLYPHRVRSLVAVTVGDHATAELARGVRDLSQACRSVLEGGGPDRLAELMAELFYAPAHVAANREAFTARAAQLAVLPRGWWEGLSGLLETLERFDVRPVLPRIACPTLVIAAGEDVVFPPDRARAVADAIPGARFELVPDSGHVLIQERPQRFVDLTLELLASLTDPTLREVSDPGPRTPGPNPQQIRDVQPSDPDTNQAGGSS
ncbi:MAG: alpha/beta fold hydrolase [Thermoanaerobaculaceae bacterium]|jgi:fatty-acyl-CoA synthase|nr:alpha/beta fold hydrolase [Thermoanaerobaculaceae bacterium]